MKYKKTETDTTSCVVPEPVGEAEEDGKKAYMA